MISVVLSVLTVLWFLLAFFLSHQGGVGTYQTSIGMAAMLYHFLKKLGIEDAISLDMVNMLLRRAAHIVVFFVLTMLVCFTLWAFRHERSVRIPSAAGYLFCLFCCWADEATKVPIAGRHFSWFDVGLNGIGCAAGILIFLLIRRKFLSAMPRHQFQDKRTPKAGSG